MPRSSRSLVARMRRWRLLTANAQPLLTDLPHVGKDVADLTALAEQVAALQAEQTYHRAKVQEITAKIRRLAARGDRIRGRVGASLRGKYGFGSAHLVQAGFKPRSTKNRAVDEDEGVPSPEPPAAKPKPSKRARAKSARSPT